MNPVRKNRPPYGMVFFKHKTQNKSVKSQGIRTGGTKERGARQPHKRLLYLYCFNVNRTSLDHLLLGRNADVDKNVE